MSNYLKKNFNDLNNQIKKILETPLITFYEDEQYIIITKSIRLVINRINLFYSRIKYTKITSKFNNFT